MGDVYSREDKKFNGVPKMVPIDQLYGAEHPTEAIKPQGITFEGEPGAVPGAVDKNKIGNASPEYAAPSNKAAIPEGVAFTAVSVPAEQESHLDISMLSLDMQVDILFKETFLAAEKLKGFKNAAAPENHGELNKPTHSYGAGVQLGAIAEIYAYCSGFLDPVAEYELELPKKEYKVSGFGTNHMTIDSNLEQIKEMIVDDEKREKLLDEAAKKIHISIVEGKPLNDYKPLLTQIDESTKTGEGSNLSWNVPLEDLFKYADDIVARLDYVASVLDNPVAVVHAKSRIESVIFQLDELRQYSVRSEMIDFHVSLDTADMVCRQDANVNKEDIQKKAGKEAGRGISYYIKKIFGN